MVLDSNKFPVQPQDERHHRYGRRGCVSSSRQRRCSGAGSAIEFGKSAWRSPSVLETQQPAEQKWSANAPPARHSRAAT